MVKIYWLFDSKSCSLSFLHCRLRHVHWHIIRDVKKQSRRTCAAQIVFTFKKRRNLKIEWNNSNDLARVRIKIMCKLHIHLKSILYLMECSKTNSSLSTRRKYRFFFGFPSKKKKKLCSMHNASKIPKSCVRHHNITNWITTQEKKYLTDPSKI